MKILPLLIAGILLFLVGCTSTPRTAPEFSHIELIGESSPIITIANSRLVKSDGKLLLTGQVIRGHLATSNSTSHIHLDIELRDASGALIGSTIEYFEPRNIPNRPWGRSFGTYRIPMDSLPAATARIVIRAHKGTQS
jgi:hypothetical protein